MNRSTAITWLTILSCVSWMPSQLEADEPPLVQMLVPGFTAHELPIELKNINNLRYRIDGKLYALGYNGDIWLLSDGDADGLEDTAHRFFENSGRLRGPIGMAVIPEHHALLSTSVREGKVAGRGVVVASKGKVSAILDMDGDDIAEEERVIASGWVEIPQNVDAIGVAISPLDGAIYFGIGVKDYNKAYQLDENGKSQFNLNTERGTIQRISPDLSERHTVCTGVRFTIGLGFDEHHELFATDQEGATWLPNGNPFDELLHLKPDRHYGFPPRHPKHLPNVFDEPSLFDYRPQHQSACGLAFNLPTKADGPTFGPPNWFGDLFVCGQSRGKIYRTRLLRTNDNEYVATNQLIACLGMLTVDCCLSPQGDLLVACHSGGPDWGSGPSGLGKIFKLRYRDSQQGQPIAIWSSAQREIRVEFDQAIDLQTLKELTKKTSIEFGEYVSAADRLETIRPGYAVTKLQQATPRESLPIHSVGITPDQRTLIFQTERHRKAVHYALSLPGLSREAQSPQASAIPQLPAIDLAYSLQGVQVEWRSNDSSISDWQGWLPHPNFDLAKKLTLGQRHPEELWKRLERPGVLTMSMQLDARGLFYPSVQPGSALDYPPEEDQFIAESSFSLKSSSPFSWGTSVGDLRPAAKQAEIYVGQSILPSRSTRAVPFVLRCETGVGTNLLNVDWLANLSNENIRRGTLHLDRFLLPWAEMEPSDETKAVDALIPQLADANWGRGRQLFYGEQAGCSKCHAVNGKGSAIGPDLSNVIHRDYESVLRDIVKPSFAINPDYITYSVLLHDSRVLVGALRSEGEQYSLSDREAKTTHFRRDEIDEMKPSTLSVMPDGVIEKLTQAQVDDLMAFLLLPPPHMPTDVKAFKTPIRRRSEIESILGTAKQSEKETMQVGSETAAPKPLSILLVAGKKDHGPGEHDYPAWLRMWSHLMAAADGVTIDTAMDWPNDEQWEAANTVVFFQKGRWTPDRAASIDRHLAKGGGLVFIHWAVEAGKDAPSFAERIGLASHSATTKYRHGDVELLFNATDAHAMTRGFDKLLLHDESYWNLHGDPKKIRVLGTASEEGELHPQFWTLERNRGRVFVSIPGHYSTTFDDPLFRILLLRGIAWTSQQAVDRFSELVWYGTNVLD